LFLTFGVPRGVPRSLSLGGVPLRVLSGSPVGVKVGDGPHGVPSQPVRDPGLPQSELAELVQTSPAPQRPRRPILRGRLACAGKCVPQTGLFVAPRPANPGASLCYIPTPCMTARRSPRTRHLGWCGTAGASPRRHEPGLRPSASSHPPRGHRG